MPSELDSLLRVSRAVARGDQPRVTLDRVAEEAARVVEAKAAAILLRRGTASALEPFEVVGSYHLGRFYRRAVEHPNPERFRTVGPTMAAISRDEQIVVEDTLEDPRNAPWRAVAEREHVRGFVCTPLHIDGEAIGSLEVYRSYPGPWEEPQLQLLSLFVRHAATALQTARLIDGQRRQLLALRRMVEVLEEQSHEHANRLHTIGGLLAIDEHEHARELLASLQLTREEDRRRIADRIQEPTIRGLLTAQTAIAAQRGIELRIGDNSSLERLPASLDEASAVTILGNLLDNAFDAVANVPRQQRRVVASFLSRPRTCVWRVRDYGSGIPDEKRAEIFSRGISGKSSTGLGLHLVAEAASRAGGTVSVRHLNSGTSFTVNLPA